MDKAFPQRRVIISFTLQNGETKNISGLEVRFQISRIAYAYGSRAQISIANLSMDDIQYLIQYMTPYLRFDQRQNIALSAGYDNEVHLLFSGHVWHAMPVKRDGEIWLDIEARRIQNTGYITAKNITGTKVPIKEVCKQVASWADKKFSWLSTSKRTLDSFYCEGSVYDAIDKLNSYGDIICYDDFDTFTVSDSSMSYEAQEYLKKEGYIVSENTGMIGMPEVKFFGVTVTTLLDNTINVGQWFKLESELAPAANDWYYARRITYTGSLRSQQFYTRIFGQRSGIVHDR